jgi:hypothetical protein
MNEKAILLISLDCSQLIILSNLEIINSTIYWIFAKINLEKFFIVLSSLKQNYLQLCQANALHLQLILVHAPGLFYPAWNSRSMAPLQ